ncbi:SOS response-associated peptidase [Flagellimonas aurea]|uniref:Abasic site processing protein n=1 Tax=Flagellimonas aurea TaxID=2915619 RepID=A0ABS3G921_9FLAO|nr:SOS response-associated peptidase [Allomuricauda aurea]MBO0355904.1 SOS response-associated peptidase [Allomuricauda aurea]UBZ14561.1 SOS response-associated peptidase [Allomuricauda aquimarina]|tara:strand:- start:231 stop:953 length:723 start_codon:yes stop_codon:yes gene_type:complete
MCYSTTLRKTKEEVEERFRARLQIELEYTPYYHMNGFTHGNLYIVPMEYPDELLPAMWGYVPPFGMDDPDAFHKRYNTLNAKSETVFSSNTYKHSIHDKRCLIIADGFHEPHHVKKVSYPYFCHYKDDSLFAFAGLYSELDDDLYSCTIITMPANEQFEQIHNQKKRQPLILDQHWEEDWLLPDLHEPGIKELMKSAFTTKEIEAYTVSRDLYKRGIDTNNKLAIEKKDYPELNQQGSLF